VTFQFTASAVSWRGRLNEYQAHAVGRGKTAPLMRAVLAGEQICPDVGQYKKRQINEELV